MKTKFFLEGHYRLTLDHIQPKEAKPTNRIHLKFAMLLVDDEMKQAPTPIRKVFELISDAELEIPKALLATKIKGIDVEIFPTPPTAKTVPILVTLNSCVLRDIQIHRLKKGEVKLFFSVGIAWDSKVWKWGGDNVFLDCFAKFHESQGMLLDESEADESLSAPPPTTEAHLTDPDSVGSLARDLRTNHRPNPLEAAPGLRTMKLMPRSKRGRGRNARVHV